MGNAGNLKPQADEILSVVVQAKFEAGDYVELLSFQTSGGALNLIIESNVETPNFSAVKVG